MSEVSKQGGFEASFEAMKRVKNASIWDAISNTEPTPLTVSPPPANAAPVPSAAPADSGPSPLRVLALLADGATVRAIQLHERSHLTFPAFQQSLTELIDGRLVERDNDGLKITEAGASMLREFALA